MASVYFVSSRRHQRQPTAAILAACQQQAIPHHRPRPTPTPPPPGLQGNQYRTPRAVAVLLAWCEALDVRTLVTYQSWYWVGDCTRGFRPYDMTLKARKAADFKGFWGTASGLTAKNRAPSLAPLIRADQGCAQSVASGIAPHASNRLATGSLGGVASCNRAGSFQAARLSSP